MDVFRIDDMKGGWFIGDFEPSVWRTRDFEVAVQRHRAGKRCEPHFHALCSEVNVIVSGALTVDGVPYCAGDILVVHPKETCEVEFLEDTQILVVKSPSVPGDKYDASRLAPSIERD